MCMRRLVISILTFIVLFKPGLQAQERTINVHHLNSSGGLADGIIRSIGQDKYGYIWMGSLSGLSRFNGYDVKVFQNDPQSEHGIPFGQVASIYGDKAGNLWIGFNHGLYQYDYRSSDFIPVDTLSGMSVNRIMEKSNGELVLGTGKGIAIFNPAQKKLSYIKDRVRIGKEFMQRAIADYCLLNDKLYMATDSGIIIYNLQTDAVQNIAPSMLPSARINRISIGNKGTIWASFTGKNEFIFKTDTTFQSYEISPQHFRIITGQGNPISEIFIDSREHMWCGVVLMGLFEYDPQTRNITRHRHKPAEFNSLSINHFNTLFEDRSGFIWVGTEGYGADYFHPGRNFFTTIMPGNDVRMPFLTFWSRIMLEDNAGNTWMGWGEGLEKRNRNDTTFIRNREGETAVLHSNSIRSLTEDFNGDIWIGTSSGVNRYDKTTGKTVFYDNKDSLPRRFVWDILRDSYNNIWFGFNRGLCYRDGKDMKIHPVSSHPVLGKLKLEGVHTLFEDSRKRLWIGANGAGLTMYDPANSQTRQWRRQPGKDSTLVGNTITSITEDKDGIIWISSFIGIVSYDPVKDVFRQFTRLQGLPSVKTSCLRVDDRNRLWIGSTSGLIMLDSSRSYFKQFDLQDGLPVMEFNDQESIRLQDGRFVFPSIKGFVVFDPASYVESEANLDFYLSSIKVHGKELPGTINNEEIQSLSLRHNQNFFSFEMAALNYMNAHQTWYAYKLEGFDKEWIYTKDRIVNYTNVPGGKYKFYYKATPDPNNWNVAQKYLVINIGTVFYKTAWFWIITALLIATLMYLYYRNRIRQQQQMHSLQTKAQLLEKEKALVMYENLKQQLNPHFLFNSLTSLSSLIRLDQKVAGEFLDSLGKTYRYILKNRESELVPLQEELKFTDTYVRLQRTRFEKGLEVVQHIEEEYYHRKIAPVTLQNLVENAIKHNIIDEESPLKIIIYTEEDHVVVRNNLQRKNYVESSNRQGLQNLQSLYSYLSNRPVIIEEDKDFFTVKIPLL